jgi:E3 ubiquitin-protein ligase UBR7
MTNQIIGKTTTCTGSFPQDVILLLTVLLQDEESLEEDAKAVLGNADDKNCTYHSGGYMTRQALYSCLTCTPVKHAGGEKTTTNAGRSGICLACSYHCHEGHELVELYTKRNFRCDCGNSKMDNECKLANDKTKTNDRNQ